MFKFQCLLWVLGEYRHQDILFSISISISQNMDASLLFSQNIFTRGQQEFSFPVPS